MRPDWGGAMMSDTPSTFYWRRSEEETLRREYPHGGAKRVARLLSNRSPEAIRARASQLGILRAPRWSPEEVATLCRTYPTEGAKRTARLLPGRGVGAVRVKAQQMGLAKLASLAGAR